MGQSLSTSVRLVINCHNPNIKKTKADGEN
jgi:hypothetical protein